MTMSYPLLIRSGAIEVEETSHTFSPCRGSVHIRIGPKMSLCDYMTLTESKYKCHVHTWIVNWSGLRIFVSSGRVIMLYRTPVWE